LKEQQKKHKKPSMIDKYAGIKREKITMILTDKDGKKTEIKV